MSHCRASSEISIVRAGRITTVVGHTPSFTSTSATAASVITKDGGGWDPSKATIRITGDLAIEHIHSG
jgi:hypothetical protein